MNPGVCNEQEVHEQLSRLLSSAGFARNERMARFLTFLVERRLAGRGDELKESVIAVEVFGRRPDYDPKSDSIVRTEAARLRARLTDYYAHEGRTDPVVFDVPKGGYIPVFRRRFEIAPGERPAPSVRRWLTVGLTCSAVVLAAATGWWQRHQHLPMRIAVLPLQNLSADPSGEYFADGLTDEIIRELSVIDGLTVRSQTSSFAYKGKPRNVHDAGKQLEADYLVEGSVLRKGEQVRINAQLIRVRDDVSLWSGRFDRRLTDLFTVQDEISLGIVNNLRLHLGRGRRRYETSAEAYSLFLGAGVPAMPRAAGSEEAPDPGQTPAQRFLRSIQSFDEALARDRSFAPAYASLACVYAVHSVQFPEDHPPDELPKMRAAAERAIQLDPLLPEAHHAIAMVHARDGQWDQAEQAFLRAIELDPARTTTYSDYAYWLLEVLGRHADALVQLHAAQNADPGSNDIRLTTALVLVSAGRYDEAADDCRRLPAGRECLARVRSGQGRFAEIIELLAHHPEASSNPQTRGFLGYAYARSGRRDEAEQMAAAARYPNEQALIFAGLGDKDRTFDALDRMAALGPQRVGLYLGYPELTLLRDDPRLSVFRRKIGLPATR